MLRKLALIAVMTAGICLAQDAAPAAAEAVQPTPTPGRPARRPPIRTPGRPGRAGVPQQRRDSAPRTVPIERLKQSAAELLEMYDTDKDGKLSAEEKAVMEREMAEAERKARLARDYMRIKVIDVDGDLVISPEEEENSQQRLREAARKRIESRQQRRVPQGAQQQAAPAAPPVVPPAAPEAKAPEAPAAPPAPPAAPAAPVE